MRQRRRLVLVVALLLAAYLGSYLWMSRRGYAEADQYGIVGFYYFFPEDSDAWWYKNYGCVFLFWPLNVIDRSLGFGRYPASEPLWGFSR
jgi:hypothetical protein